MARNMNHMKYWWWMFLQITAVRSLTWLPRRKGEMLVMESKGEMQHLEFEIPSRGLIGLRSNMLTNTAGEAVMAHRFLEYKPWKGSDSRKKQRCIVVEEPGKNNSLFH